MNLIFEIGIIIIGLGFIKWLLFMLAMFFSQSLPIFSQRANFISKIISYYFICSLVAVQIHQNSTSFSGKWPWIISSITLFLYFVGKYEQRSMVRFQINQFNSQKQDQLPPKMELGLISLCLFYFLSTMFFPNIVEWPLLLNLSAMIHNLADTIIIGWIIKIIAFFFLIQTLFSGVNQINRLLFHRGSVRNTPNDKDEDEFDDYEEVE